MAIAANIKPTIANKFANKWNIFVFEQNSSSYKSGKKNSIPLKILNSVAAAIEHKKITVFQERIIAQVESAAYYLPKCEAAVKLKELLDTKYLKDQFNEIMQKKDPDFMTRNKETADNIMRALILSNMDMLMRELAVFGKIKGVPASQEQDSGTHYHSGTAIDIIKQVNSARDEIIRLNLGQKAVEEEFAKMQDIYLAIFRDVIGVKCTEAVIKEAMLKSDEEAKAKIKDALAKDDLGMLIEGLKTYCDGNADETVLNAVNVLVWLKNKHEGSKSHAQANFYSSQTKIMFNKLRKACNVDKLQAAAVEEMEESPASIESPVTKRTESKQSIPDLPNIADMEKIADQVFNEVERSKNASKIPLQGTPVKERSEATDPVIEQSLIAEMRAGQAVSEIKQDTEINSPISVGAITVKSIIEMATAGELNAAAIAQIVGKMKEFISDDRQREHEVISALMEQGATDIVLAYEQKLESNGEHQTP